jgi:hypothetical protein
VPNCQSGADCLLLDKVGARGPDYEFTIHTYVLEYTVSYLTFGYRVYNKQHALRVASRDRGSVQQLHFLPNEPVNDGRAGAPAPSPQTDEEGIRPHRRR